MCCLHPEGEPSTHRWMGEETKERRRSPQTGTPEEGDQKEKPRKEKGMGCGRAKQEPTEGRARKAGNTPGREGTSGAQKKKEKEGDRNKKKVPEVADKKKTPKKETKSGGRKDPASPKRQKRPKKKKKRAVGKTEGGKRKKKQQATPKTEDGGKPRNTSQIPQRGARKKKEDRKGKRHPQDTREGMGCWVKVVAFGGRGYTTTQGWKGDTTGDEGGADMGRLKGGCFYIFRKGGGFSFCCCFSSGADLQWFLILVNFIEGRGY